NDPRTIPSGTEGDLLIAGSTLFDTDPQALFQIVHEWASGRSYAERVTRLENGVSGLPRLDPTTVLDDHVVDQLFASRDLDWMIFTAGQDQLANRELFRVPAVPFFQARRPQKP